MMIHLQNVANPTAGLLDGARSDPVSGSLAWTVFGKKRPQLDPKTESEKKETRLSKKSHSKKIQTKGCVQKRMAAKGVQKGMERNAGCSGKTLNLLTFFYYNRDFQQAAHFRHG